MGELCPLGVRTEAPQPGEMAIKFREQKIIVEGVDEGNYTYVNGEPNSGTEELILVWTNCALDAINTLTVSNNIEARMLLVGGGGAGGYDTTISPNPGGGGAGGYGTNNSSNPGGGGGGGSVKLEFIFLLPRLRRRRRLRHRRRRRSRRRQSWGWQPIVVTLNLILRCLLVLKDYFDLTL